MQTYNAVKLAHLLLLPHLKNCRCAVDATAGNGWDSLFLAANTSNETIIYSFDIQKSALAKTQSLLREHNVSDKLRLIEDSHENMAIYIKEKLDIVMFNLGYLPGSDHGFTTQPATTIKSVTKSLELLNAGGFLTIIAYPGHPTGELEFIEIEKLLKSLSTKFFAVNSWVPVNAAKRPPILYIIEKVRSELGESATSC
ncbi:hypothetical protein SDC9_30324 [bioreactor metagenome]|uniref:Uncharacterized protein n=1 Tax=bioreactor metagenome TaxID=1076179 RepID=A0A644UZ51_9ZZZZ|nr:class I SAM-dependent methyltransferase [Negativicutes bacterium]